MSLIDETLVRTVLGETSASELQAHELRMSQDAAYRETFNQLSRLQHDLVSLPEPVGTPAHDRRILAAVGAQQDPARVFTTALSHQFWRVAAPALAAAAILLVLATQRSTDTSDTSTETLSTWYPISADPTARS